MTISISVDTSEVAAALSKLSKAVQGDAMRKGLMAGALLVEADAKRRAPVDTGALRNSIRAEMRSDTVAIVGTGLNYSPHVEYGTSRSAAQPYLRPAAESQKGAVVDIIAATIRGAQ